MPIDDYRLDLIAFIFFVCCWGFYTYFADRRAYYSGSLSNVAGRLRQLWISRMLEREREQRTMDTLISGYTLASVTFFASTSIVIIAGLLAALSRADVINQVLGEVPFVSPVPLVIQHLRIISLIFVFIYAFFKCTWSLRQALFGLVVIGSAPVSDISADEREFQARHIARIFSMAGSSFNQGLRAYYYAMAMLSWFLHPLLFITASIVVTVILYHREFKSETLKALLQALPEWR